MNKELNHGLITYIDTKANCRHLKQWPVKGFAGRCLSESWYFRPSFVKSCPSNLLSGSTLPLPPYLCVQVYCRHVCQCVRGVRGYGPPTDKYRPQSPFAGNFFTGHFALPSISLIFLRTELGNYHLRKKMVDTKFSFCLWCCQFYCHILPPLNFIQWGKTDITPWPKGDGLSR
jgi:hypothetical protein